MAQTVHINHDTVNSNYGLAIVYFLLYTFISVLVFAIIDTYALFDTFIKFMSDHAYASFHCRMEIAKKLDHRINGGTLEEGSNVSLDSVREQAFQEQRIAGMHVLDEIKRTKPKRSGLFLQNVEEEQYKEHKSNFFESLLRSTYYGISPIMCREGACCCWFIKDKPIGFLEDLYYKFLNTNTIVSMLTACHGHPFGREKKKIAFIIHSALGLSFALLLSSISNSGTKILLNIFVVAPTTLFINEFVYLNLSCPCLVPYKYGHYMSYCVNWIESFGRLTVAPLFVASLVLVILCAIFAVTNDGGHFLSYYIIQTQIVSLGGELVMLYLQFLDGKSYYSVNIFGLTVLSFGKWFNEYLTAYRYNVVNEGYYEEKLFGYIGYLSITKRYSTDKTFANIFVIDHLYIDRNKVFPINNSNDLVTNIVTDPNKLQTSIAASSALPCSVAVGTVDGIEIVSNLTSVTATTAIVGANDSTASIAVVGAAIIAPISSIAETQLSHHTVPVETSATMPQSSIEGGILTEVLRSIPSNVNLEIVQSDLGQGISTGWN